MKYLFPFVKTLPGMFNLTQPFSEEEGPEPLPDNNKKMKQ